jgi:carboxypeptidase C (cathepsin A)
MAESEQTPLLAPGIGLLASVRARRAFLAKFAVATALFALALWAAGDAYAKKHVSVAKPPPYVCGDAAKSHSGHIKLANKQDDHYFYWFFEAEQDTGKEPLVLWLTGGPGSSSLFALLTENGPCTINADLSTTTNAYAWNHNANYIWLEQPTGVGFSFGAAADEDYDETDVGANIYWFLQGFLKQFPQFEGREFYITGESYGGHYVPGASHYVWQQTKQQLANPGAFPNTSIINIKGIAIGNGLTNPVIQVPTRSLTLPACMHHSECSRCRCPPP